MKYFGPAIFAIGLAMVINVWSPSQAIAVQDAVEQAKSHVTGWRLDMFLAWLAMVVGLNMFLLAMLRECRRHAGMPARAPSWQEE